MQLKYLSAQIGMMDEALFQKHSKALLLKINIITGWSLPESEEMANIIVDQFQKLLREEFAELNVGEIEHAFRTKCDTVEDWGKNLNLSLINRILKPYLKERYYISDMEERLKAKDDGYSEQASLNYWREQIEKSYQAFINGKEPYLYHYMLDVLALDFKIAEPKLVQQLDKEKKCKVVLRCFKRFKEEGGMKNIYQKG